MKLKSRETKTVSKKKTHFELSLPEFHHRQHKKTQQIKMREGDKHNSMTNLKKGIREEEENEENVTIFSSSSCEQEEGRMTMMIIAFVHEKCR